MARSSRGAIFNQLLCSVGDLDDVCPEPVVFGSLPVKSLPSFGVTTLMGQKLREFPLPLSPEDVAKLDQDGFRHAYGSVLVNKKEFFVCLTEPWQRILVSILSTFCKVMVPINEHTRIITHSLVIQTKESPVGGIFRVHAGPRDLAVLLLSPGSEFTGGDVKFSYGTVHYSGQLGHGGSSMDVHVAGFLPGVEGHFSPITSGHRLFFVCLLRQEGEEKPRPIQSVPLSFGPLLARVANLEAEKGNGLAFLLTNNQSTTATAEAIKTSCGRRILVLQSQCEDIWGQNWGWAFCQVKMDRSKEPSFQWFHCSSCDPFDDPTNFNFDLKMVVDFKNQKLGVGHLGLKKGESNVFWVLYIDTREVDVAIMKP